MRRAVQKNKNKQKQEIKNNKIKKHNEIYSKDKSYMNITLVHLSSIPLEVDIKVPYNFILRDTIGFSNHEITYLCRSSDLIILTVTNENINNELITLIKRSMPTAIIVYGNRQKNTAKVVSKSFGGAKMCEVAMINVILEKIETVNTNLTISRPFMIPAEIRFDSCYMYARGFMKNGLRSDKVIINGIHEAIIEEVTLDDEIIPGYKLNVLEKEEVLQMANDNTNDDIEEMLSENDEVEYESMEEGDDFEEEEFDLEAAEPINPECDLITKYSEYRGIRSLKTCSFKDQKVPDHYKDIVFVKNFKYALSQVKSNSSIIPKNKEVLLKIKLFGPIPENICVIYNLVEYETRKTIHNFDFSSSAEVPKEIFVDLGYRIFKTTCNTTRNLNHNVFKIEPDLLNGVVSFIGPISLFGDTAYILGNDINSLNVTKLLNGRTEDRLFFECVELKGKPIKVCKSYVVIKGMFFNKEQVEYFSNIKVESKNGIMGFIKKPLGTKGLFKAFFAQPVKHGDTVKMSLYKRIFL